MCAYLSSIREEPLAQPVLAEHSHPFENCQGIRFYGGIAACVTTGSLAIVTNSVNMTFQTNLQSCASLAQLARG